MWRAAGFKNNDSGGGRLGHWPLGVSLCTRHGLLSSRIVNESRQVPQEPNFTQSLLRGPNTPIIRKSRGTSTQGMSTHASSTQLAMVDDQHSKAGSVRSKVSSYHGSLHRSRDGRCVSRGPRAGGGGGGMGVGGAGGQLGSGHTPEKSNGFQLCWVPLSQVTVGLKASLRRLC